MNIILISYLLSFLFADDVCINWFNKLQIRKDDSCLMNCSIAPVNMQTFNCTSQCKNLCNQEIEAINKIAYYVGFTVEEIKYSTKNPEKAFKAYEMQKLANSMTKQIFKRNLNGDESDAFRHFVWAGLLAKEISIEDAKIILMAHEYGQDLDSVNRKMDIFNNEKGLKEAEELLNKKQLNKESIEQEAIKAIKNNELNVINKMGGF